MIQRFQIEDLVLQDMSGVLFRAFDTETNQTVAVRRFFPFGAAGGGLREDEQIAYNIAVERLAGISHPALRSVICGGCDPVDGMPYIATEWIEGTRLQAYIENRPLTQEETTNLLTQALEVCELLSQVLAEEAVWVETELQAIIVGAEGSGRGITFSIAPLKWLGKNDGQRGLESIIGLTEDVMGWRGRSIADQTGTGIGGWLKWFRGAARTTTLHEAREMLAASIGVEPPIPAKNLVRQATRPMAAGRKKKKAAGWPFFIFGTLALAAVGLGGWALVNRNNSSASDAIPISEEITGLDDPAPATEIPAEPVEAVAIPIPRSPGRERTAGQASRNAAEMTAKLRELEAANEARRVEIRSKGDIFGVADRELLLERKNAEVSLEGRLVDVGFSTSGATLYLKFSNTGSDREPRGYIMKKDLNGEMNLAALQKFVGKNVRLHGKVKTPTSQHRPEIEIKSLASIEEAK